MTVWNGILLRKPSPDKLDVMEGAGEVWRVALLRVDYLLVLRPSSLKVSCWSRLKSYTAITTEAARGRWWLSSAASGRRWIKRNPFDHQATWVVTVVTWVLSNGGLGWTPDCLNPKFMYRRCGVENPQCTQNSDELMIYTDIRWYGIF